MTKKNKNPKTIMHTLLSDLLLAKDSPRLQILIAGSTLEMFVDVKVLHECKHGEMISQAIQYTHAIKLILLHEKSLISDPMYRILTNFKNLRNDAAHEAQFKLTDKMLEPFEVDLDYFGFPQLKGMVTFTDFCFWVPSFFAHQNKVIEKHYGKELHELDLQRLQDIKNPSPAKVRVERVKSVMPLSSE